MMLSDDVSHAHWIMMILWGIWFLKIFGH